MTKTSASENTYLCTSVCCQIAMLFFELLRISVGAARSFSHIPSSSEWVEMYNVAGKQTLIGVCFAGVQRLCDEQPEMVANLPDDLKLKWIANAVGIQQRNELIDRRCVELQTKLSVAGFRTYIMKGQGNAAIYDGELGTLRQPGDIDIFLDGGYKRVIDYVNSTFPTRDVNELEIHYHCFRDVEVEIHYHPFIMRDPFKNSRLQKFFEAEKERCFEHKIELPSGAWDITVPTPCFNLVHQLIHIRHHLYTEGIGLRQLMDYYFVLLDVHARHADTSKAKIVVQELGLERFAEALMWVMQEVFALEASAVLWVSNPADGRMILNEVVRSGNFGRADEQRGCLNSRWRSFWLVNGKAFRFARFDWWAWLWTPLWRLWHFGWRKIHGYR